MLLLSLSILCVYVVLWMPLERTWSQDRRWRGKSKMKEDNSLWRPWKKKKMLLTCDLLLSMSELFHHIFFLWHWTTFPAFVIPVSNFCRIQIKISKSLPFFRSSSERQQLHSTRLHTSTHLASLPVSHTEVEPAELIYKAQLCFRNAPCCLPSAHCSTDLTSSSSSSERQPCWIHKASLCSRKASGETSTTSSSH